MEWLTLLTGQTIGLDTAPVIYFIERNPRYLDAVRPFFVALDQGDFNVVTSIVTLLEALVYPLRHGDRILAQQYERILLKAANVRTHPVSEEIAREAARLRAEYSIRTPDSIQMATAICHGASFLLTNDNRLPADAGLTVLVLNELL